jgi:DNA-binding CsgD family transcriptional regulator
VKLLSYWPLLPFIFGVYAVAGLIYSVIFPTWSDTGHETELFHLVLGVLPRIGLLFVAGTLVDILGRRINAIIGAVMIGAGFMLVGLLGGVVQDISAHAFIIGGFAFLDVFVWTVLGDISSTRRVSLYYGAGLALNTFAIFLGVLLGDRVMSLAGRTEILTVELAGLLSFLSLACVPALTETLRRSWAVVPLGDEPLGKLFEDATLTRRETDVAKLLAAGVSTEEIRHTLNISPDTLKSHLRNIYGKVGVKNRLELTLLMVNELHKVNRDDETNH